MNLAPRTKGKPYTGPRDKIFEVLWDMKINGYVESTIEPAGKRLRNLAKHTNLDNSDEVKEFIALAKWSDGYKENMVTAYNHHVVLVAYFRACVVSCPKI